MASDLIAAAFKSGDHVTPKTLVSHRLIKDIDKPIVILGDGEINKKLNVSAHRLSKSARAKIEEAGGTVTVLELAVRGARATVKLLPKAQRAKLEAK